MVLCFYNKVPLGLDTQRVVWTRALVSPGSSLEMLTLRTHPRPQESAPAFLTRCLGDSCALWGSELRGSAESIYQPQHSLPTKVRELTASHCFWAGVTERRCWSKKKPLGQLPPTQIPLSGPSPGRPLIWKKSGTDPLEHSVVPGELRH